MSRQEKGMRPFERAVFYKLSFEAEQIQKVDISIGKRSQSIVFKFALTPEQVAQLDAMASEFADDPEENNEDNS